MRTPQRQQGLPPLAPSVLHPLYAGRLAKALALEAIGIPKVSWPHVGDGICRWVGGDATVHAWHTRLLCAGAMPRQALPLFLCQTYCTASVPLSQHTSVGHYVTWGRSPFAGWRRGRLLRSVKVRSASGRGVAASFAVSGFPQAGISRLASAGGRSAWAPSSPALASILVSGCLSSAWTAAPSWRPRSLSNDQAVVDRSVDHRPRSVLSRDPSGTARGLPAPGRAYAAAPSGSRTGSRLGTASLRSHPQAGLCSN